MSSLALHRHVIAQQLGLDPDHIDPDRPLSSYGLDSLQSIEMIAALESATGRTVPESLWFDCPTLTALASALDGDVPDASPWRDDLAVPADFVVAEGQPSRDPRHVFLTGATGLVGGYLLRTLIDDTDAQVWCLVRTEPGGGLERIRANLTRYGLWDEAMARRIHVVRGNLCALQLGLADAEYVNVATITDAVLHAAADVDWVQPYSALRGVNVLGTLEVLRLAGVARPKPVQFISSLSVCHVPDGPPVIDELTDCEPFIESLPLGYAQTKCAAEALCGGANRRGLPVRVIRPSLIGGDSRSGVSNADDLVGRLVRGCIEMRAAPDLDWSFDAVPVDELARAIVGAPWPRTGALDRVHHVSRRPRSWQEVVLWINALGYECRLVPFAAWRDRLEWVARSRSHPLAPLRPFFAAGGLGRDSAAELCQATRHSAVATTSPGDGAAALTVPRGVDAPMLARQIDTYVAAGVLRASCRTRVIRASRPPAWQRSAHLEGILREQLGIDLIVRSVEAVDIDPTPGLVSDLSSWRRGRDTGVFRYRITIERQGETQELAVVIKSRAHDEDSLEAARALAAACDDGLEREVRRFEHAIGLHGAGDREVQLYQHAPSALRRFMPMCYGAWRQNDDAGAGVVIEDLHDRARLNATEPGDWTEAAILLALEDLAAMHTAGLDDGARRLVVPLRRPADVVEMTPLWIALARHAAAGFERMAGPALTARHAMLVATIDRWAPALDVSASTLIHHDFSPRNAALRTSGLGRALVAYDWELATTGPPQRDLAEFLCFVLPADVPADRVVWLVGHYRCLLERASARSWEAEAWQAGFRAALSLLLVDRLAFYAMIARVRPQPFLPGVLRTWHRIDAAISPFTFQGHRQ